MKTSTASGVKVPEIKNWEEVVCVVSNQAYKKAKAADFTYYPGQGFVHISHDGYFRSVYAECFVRKKWFHSSGMQRIHRDYTPGLYAQGLSGRVSKAEFNKNWVMCQSTGEGVRTTDTTRVYNRYAEAMLVYKPRVKTHFLKDEITGLLFDRGCFVTPEKNKSKKYNSISIHSAGNCKDLIPCCHCASYFDIGDPVISKRPDMENQLYCDECYEAAQLQGVIKDYSCRDYPKPIIMAPPLKDGRHPHVVLRGGEPVVRKDVRLYGVEAEVECHASPGTAKLKMAFSVQKTLGKEFVIIKHDGSLTNGFEIVSGPCDLATHRTYWPKLNEVKEHDKLRAWNTDSCGFHVHVSKVSLNAMQLGRILFFINHPSNKIFVQKVAGRTNERWSKYVPKKLSDSLNPDEDKYVAVNLKHKETIEFRIFRGTIHPRHIIRNLEFVDAVCQFCYPCGRSFKELESYAAFINFCRSSRKDYPLLVEWMEYHELVPKRKLAPGAKESVVDEPTSSDDVKLPKIARPTRSRTGPEHATTAQQASLF